MTINEKAIIHQRGPYWVCAVRHTYTVYRDGVTHATADSAYPKTDDGLSLAIARVDYLRRAAD